MCGPPGRPEWGRGLARRSWGRPAQEARGNGAAVGADGGAALGDVAVADPVRLPELLAAVEGVERVHLERRGVDQVARAHELLVQVMVAQHVADVLAEEALDALPELLNPVHV